MLKIRDEDVKHALKNGMKELNEIHNRLIALHTELTNADSLIRSVSINKIRYGEFEGGTSSDKKDLCDVMQKHEKIARAREIEIREEMRQLTKEEESINRIRVCFQSLRGQEYAFLNELYVKGYPYKLVEEHSGISHSRFEAVRKKGIKKIIQLYESNYSNQEIITQRHRIYRNNTKKGEVVYRQLTLDLKA